MILSFGIQGILTKIRSMSIDGKMREESYICGGSIFESPDFQFGIAQIFFRFVPDDGIK